MKSEISFCPLCAGKLDANDDEQFVCEDCEGQFLIQVVDEGDVDDEEEDDDDDDDDDDDNEEDDEDDEVDDSDDEDA